MANVWHVYEGPHPTRGGAQHVLALDDCIKKLGLAKDHHIVEERLSGPFLTPRFDSEDDKLILFKKPKHVVIDVGEAEAQAHGWEPGFYHLPLSPAEAEARLRSD